MTEAQLLEAVIDAAHFYGWRVAHFRPAKTERGWRTPVQADGKGWPDLTLVRERIVFAELKVGRGKLSPAQEHWTAALALAGCEVYAWRDGDWIDGSIERVLRRRDAPTPGGLRPSTATGVRRLPEVQAVVDRSRWFGR